MDETQKMADEVLNQLRNGKICDALHGIGLLLMLPKLGIEPSLGKKVQLLSEKLRPYDAFLGPIVKKLQ